MFGEIQDGVQDGHSNQKNTSLVQVTHPICGLIIIKMF